MEGIAEYGMSYGPHACRAVLSSAGLTERRAAQEVASRRQVEERLAAQLEAEEDVLEHRQAEEEVGAQRQGEEEAARLQRALRSIPSRRLAAAEDLPACEAPGETLERASRRINLEEANSRRLHNL